jgi:biotin operon repressor
MTDPELTEAQDKVMTEVSDAANRGEPLDVSKIARATGLSEDDVWDALQYLTSIGYVTPMLPPKLDD